MHSSGLQLRGQGARTRARDGSRAPCGPALHQTLPHTRQHMQALQPSFALSTDTTGSVYMFKEDTATASPAPTAVAERPVVASEDKPQVSLGTVIIAGASPAGIATAVGLAKRGARVIVVDPREGPAVNESYPLIVNSRGVMGLKTAGLPVISEGEAIPHQFSAFGPARIPMGWKTALSRSQKYADQYLLDNRIFNEALYTAATSVVTPETPKKDEAAAPQPPRQPSPFPDFESLFKAQKSPSKTPERQMSPADALEVAAGEGTPGTITWAWGTKLGAIDIKSRTVELTTASSPTPTRKPPSRGKPAPPAVSNGKANKAAAAAAAGSSNGRPKGGAVPSRSTASVSSVDIEEPPKQSKVNYDLLVGVDGPQSSVRDALVQAGYVTVEQLYYNPEHTFKPFSGLPAGQAGGGWPWENRALEKEVEQVLPGVKNDPPFAVLYGFSKPEAPSVVMVKCNDGTLSGMVIRSPTYKANAMREAMQSAYPDLPKAWIDSIVSQTSEESGATAQSYGAVLKLSQLHGPNVVLLGDAGHPVTNTLGQGLSLALESVHVFLRSLDQTSNLTAVGPKFTTARIRDVHAMQAMEHWHALTTNLPGTEKDPAGKTRALMHESAFTTVGGILHKINPQRYPTPLVLFTMLRDARIPYRRVRRTLIIQETVLDTLAFAALVGLYAWSVAFVRALG